MPLPIGNALKTGQPIRTNARACTILPQFIGVKFQVHNGKEYVEFQVTENMVGNKLGHYAITKKQVIHKVKKVKQ